MTELAQKLVMKGGLEKRQVCKSSPTVWTGVMTNSSFACLFKIKKKKKKSTV